MAADFLKELNSLVSDVKAIKLLFSNNPEELYRQQRINQEKQTSLKKELAATDKQLLELKQEKAIAGEQAWQPLYA